MNFHFNKLNKKGGGIKIRRFLSFRKGPYYDWKILLLFFLCSSLIILALSTYIFIGVKKGDLFQVDPEKETTSSVFDQSLMKEIIADFEVKKIRYDELRSEKIDAGGYSL